MRKVFVLMLLGAFVFCIPAKQVFAGGSGVYPNGAEGFNVGFVPPPGFYFRNYAYYYTADGMYNDRGDEIVVFDEVEVKADVLRFIWISKKKLLGGQYGQHLFIPYLDVDLDFDVPLGPESKTSYSWDGVPYLIYSPLILAYHFLDGKFHMVLSLPDIYVPLGQDDDNLANAGSNFWTFEPVAAFTYYYKNWEFSTKFMYDISTEQDDEPTVYGFEVDRTPGQEFHADYNISYALTKAFRLGVGGYYYRQMTDDDYDIDSNLPLPVQQGLDSDEDDRSEVFAVGPGLWYNYKNMFFSLRSQWETEAQAATEGYNIWFKFTYAF